ncbi:MAG: hypothetical protein WC291_11870 [Thermodesulfovibrionales bacterium]|jgi:hypothetical protein
MRLRFFFVSAGMTGFADPSTQAIHPGLAEVAGFLSGFDAEIVHLDRACLAGLPEQGISAEEFGERIGEAQPCDAVIVTASSSHALRETVKAVRDILGGIPVILGTADDTIYREQTGEEPGVDLIFTGPVEALPFALRTFGFRLRRKRVRREDQK